MRPRTLRVIDLITALEKLPPESHIYLLTWCGQDLLQSLNDLFGIYERNGETRLYIDTGEASHPDLEPFLKDLVGDGE